MAKLYFRYGTMNSGKSSLLMQVAHNYDENGKKVIVLKPSIDTKGSNSLSSRIGLTRKVDYLIQENDSIINDTDIIKQNPDCILIDEVQFLTKDQIDELWHITKVHHIPVICYGLRTDFRTKGFPGSVRLLELADNLEEIVTICSCGTKARFVGRKVNDKYVSSGEQVVIDGSTDEVEYIPLCGRCYIQKVTRISKQNIDI